MLIEQAMVFALGFLAALLTVLLFLPAFWSRAIRLSVRRVSEQMPLSMAEIAAERDGIRAESAIIHRRLEQERNRALAAHTKLRGEQGRMVMTVADLQQSVEAQRLQASELETTLASTESALSATEATLAAMRKDHYDASGLLERANRAVEQLHVEVQRVRDVSDQRRVSIASLETRSEGLQARIDDLEASLLDADRVLSQKNNDLQLTTRARDEARTEVVRLQGRRAELDARVAAQADHITRLESGGDAAGHARAASPDLARRLAIIAQRDETILADASRYAQLEAQMKRLELEHAEAAQQMSLRIEALRTEKDDVEGALDTARRERDAAQGELRLVRAAHGLPGAAMAVAENEDLALLRRSIVEVAADVVRLMGDKDGGAELARANVLHLRREWAGGNREAGKPAAADSSGQNQAVGAKLS